MGSIRLWLLTYIVTTPPTEFLKSGLPYTTFFAWEALQTFNRVKVEYHKE
jgi:hypothetical protein